MVKDHSVKEETRCRHYMGYSFRLAARVLLYASSHRQDNTYHDLCYTSRGALVGARTPINEENKEMFYLTTHSAHFIYGYMTNDSERGNPLPQSHELLFPISI